MGLSDRKISKWFNDKEIRSVRGRKFTCGLVWEIRKKYLRSMERRKNDIDGIISEMRYELE